MSFNDKNVLNFLRGLVLFYGSLIAYITIQLRQYILDEELFEIHEIIAPVYLLSLGTAGILGIILIASWGKLGKRLTDYGQRFLGWFGKKSKHFHWVTAGAGVILPFVLILNQFFCEFHINRACYYFQNFELQALALGTGWVALFLSLLTLRNDLSKRVVFALSVLLMGFAYDVVFIFNSVTTYALSLGWSETSRYYLASLFWSEKVYGIDLPWTIYHPSRYILQSIPFLLPNSTLWMHRLWAALLWFGLTLGTALLLANRLKIKKKSIYWVLFVLWAYLYLRQGAVFFQLLPCVILILWGFDKDKYWKSMIVVMAASLWAGISRFNWIPIPGLFAAVLFYLETAVEDERLLSWNYFLRSFMFFVIGSITAAGAYYGYINLSGNHDFSQFGSAFTSELIWARLWPTISFKPGILGGGLLITVPLLALAVQHIRAEKQEWHRLRLLGLGAITLVLFAGGLVVSVKIGGGTNLHNLDAYMIVVMLVGSYVLFNRHGKETDKKDKSWEPKRLNGFIEWVILIPAIFVIIQQPLIPQPEKALAKKALRELNQSIENISETDKDILFISQRHLVIFDMLDEKSILIPEYEKLTLMEMAMSKNLTYLEQFYEDIANQRFDMIVADPIHLKLKNVSKDTLAAEHNAWVTYIAGPISCAYEKGFTDLRAWVQELRPRDALVCEVAPGALFEDK